MTPDFFFFFNTVANFDGTSNREKLMCRMESEVMKARGLREWLAWVDGIL